MPTDDPEDDGADFGGSVEEPSEVDTGSTHKPGYPPSRTAGLRPWVPGQSGNPSGLCADGSAPKTARVRQDLQTKLADPKTRRRFINSWFEAACSGDAKAREQILQRVDPVIADDQRQGVVVFDGITLELRSRTSAIPPEPHDVAIESASTPFALPRSAESRGGDDSQGESGTADPVNDSPRSPTESPES